TTRGEQKSGGYYLYYYLYYGYYGLGGLGDYLYYDLYLLRLDLDECSFAM
ncbi:unnamed protein product, partial [Rotaria sordida]